MPGKVQLSQSQAVLEIPNFQQEDEGFYECAAGNLRGRSLAKGQLVFYGELSSKHAYAWLPTCFLVNAEGPELVVKASWGTGRCAAKSACFPVMAGRGG